MRIAALLLASALAACADTSAAPDSGIDAPRSGMPTACETRSRPVSDVDAHFCVERLYSSEPELIGIRAGCEAASAVDGGIDIRNVFTLGPCTREGTVGSCTVSGGASSYVMWWYADSVPPPSMASCDSLGGVWAEPP